MSKENAFGATRLRRRQVLRLLGMGALGTVFLEACGELTATALPLSNPTSPANPGTAQSATAPSTPSSTNPSNTTAASAAQSGKNPVEIRLGHGFAAEEPLWLLLADPSLAPNYGKLYTAKGTPFRANADRFTAFQAGQLDGGTVAAFTSLFAKAEGVNLKAVATLCQEAVGNGFDTTYMSLSDSGIAKPSDLKGKTIGIVDYKSSTDMWARTAVESAGLNPDRDVKFAVIPFPNMGDALRSKKIDVGTFVQPFYATEKSKGGVTEVFTSKTGIPFTEDLIFVFFSEDFLKKNREATQAFLSDLQKVTQYYLANGEKARQTLIDKKFVQTPPSIYLKLNDWARRADLRIDSEALKKLQDKVAGLGWLENPLPVDQLVDLSYLPKS